MAVDGFFISFSVISIAVLAAKGVVLRILEIVMVLEAELCVHTGLVAMFRLQVIVVTEDTKGDTVEGYVIIMIPFRGIECTVVKFRYIVVL